MRRIHRIPADRTLSARTEIQLTSRREAFADAPGTLFVLFEVPLPFTPDGLAGVLRSCEGTPDVAIARATEACKLTGAALGRANQMVEGGANAVDIMFHGPAVTPEERSAGKPKPSVWYVRIGRGSGLAAGSSGSPRTA